MPPQYRSGGFKYKAKRLSNGGQEKVRSAPERISEWSSLQNGEISIPFLKIKPEGAAHRKPMLLENQVSFIQKIKPEGAAHRKPVLL